MNIQFLFSIFEFGVIFSLLAVLVERFMITFGLARGNLIYLVIGAFVLIIFKQLIDHNSPLYIFCLMLL